MPNPVVLSRPTLIQSAAGMTQILAVLFSLSAPPALAANVDPKCEEAAAAARADPPDEQGQQNFLLNYFSLATSFSPLHGVLPNEPGHGAVSFEASIIPALSCERRLVFQGTKTEDTNKAPLLPRPRLTFTLPKVGPVALYGGLGYVPPVTMFGTRNVIVSGEAGLGVQLEGGLGFGARYHFTLLRTIADVATAFDPADDPVLDFYSGSTFGIDGMMGYQAHLGRGDHPLSLEPYLALGFADVSTFFWVGDDGRVGDNTEPYSGLAGSLGVQLQWRHVQGAAEFYLAPGYVTTGRFRIGAAI